MPDIYDIDPLQNFMALFVGPNGGGKSIALNSWLEKGSIYNFDFDGRMASVANWYRQRGLKQGQLSYDTYGPRNLFDALNKLNDFTDYCPHAAISIDSFTAVTVSAVMFSLSQRMPKRGKDAPSKSKGDLIIPDWDEYKGETVVITQMIDMCKAIAARGTAVFWTAHPVQSTKVGQGAGGTGVSVSIQTRYAAYGFKSDSLIPIYFNEIYFFATQYDHVNESRRRLCFTQPYDEINAKTALNLPAMFDWTDKNFYKEFERHVREGGSMNRPSNEQESADETVTKQEEPNQFGF